MTDKPVNETPYPFYLPPPDREPATKADRRLFEQEFKATFTDEITSSGSYACRIEQLTEKEKQDNLRTLAEQIKTFSGVSQERLDRVQAGITAIFDAQEEHFRKALEAFCEQHKDKAETHRLIQFPVKSERPYEFRGVPYESRTVYTKLYTLVPNEEWERIGQDRSRVFIDPVLSCRVVFELKVG